MKITFQAFNWKIICNKIGIDGILNDKFKYEYPEPDSEDYKNYIQNDIPTRRVYVYPNNSGIYNGLVLTIKHMKKFCTLTEDEQNSLFSTFQLKDNERIVDFNFFVFDSESGLGLYQHYHGACSLNSFNQIMRTQFLRYIHHKQENEIRGAESRNASKNEISEIKKMFKAKLDFSIIIRQGSFEEKIKRMKDVDQVSLSVTDISSGSFSTVSSSVRRISMSYYMIQNNSITDKINAIISILGSTIPDSASAHGQDEFGTDVIYKINKDYDRFATFDYNDLASDLAVDMANAKESIEKNNIILTLKSEYEKIKNILS